MTLAQRAAFLDQLKLPIEDAPRDGGYLWLQFGGNIGWIKGRWDRQTSHKTPKPYWSANSVWGVVSERRLQPTHFLPLPIPGPVEFEVVPSAIEQFKREEAAYVRGLETGAEVGRLEGEE